MTLRSCKRESDEMNSSDMPSEKYSLAGSPVELTSGSTAMDLWGTEVRLCPARGKRKETATAPSRAASVASSCHVIRFDLTTVDGVGASGAIWRTLAVG